MKSEILVIDDNSDIRLLICNILKDNNFTVREAANYNQAVFEVNKKLPDLTILDINKKKRTIFIIEASSFQLAYSKFIKPNYAFILNVSRDHLDWHGSMRKYIQSKLNIFSLQEKNDFKRF